MTLTTPMVYIVRGEEEDCSKEEWRVSFHKITVDEGEEWVPHPPSVPSSESIMWTSLPAICRGRQLVNDRRATVPSDAIACCPSVRPSIYHSLVGPCARACVFRWSVHKPLLIIPVIKQLSTSGQMDWIQTPKWQHHKLLVGHFTSRHSVLESTAEAAVAAAEAETEAVAAASAALDFYYRFIIIGLPRALVNHIVIIVISSNLPTCLATAETATRRLRVTERQRDI